MSRHRYGMVRSVGFSFSLAGLFCPLIHGQEFDASTSSSAPIERSVSSIASSRISIDYKVQDGSGPLTKVELWVTQDRGRSWQQATLDQSIPQPIVYNAAGDGLYGFYLVLQNAKGSSAAPGRGSTPQRWVRVDRSAPIVQILSLTPDTRFDLNREVRIRWSAHDENFADRPVFLHYRTEQTKSFQLIAGSQPVEGSYRWTLPEGVSGRLEIKVSAVDRAENRGRQIDDGLRIKKGRIFRVLSGGGSIEAGFNASRPVKDGIGKQGSEAPFPSEALGIHSEPDAGRSGPTSGALLGAKRHYDLGTWHRLRGENQVAIERYRQAIRRYDGFIAARNDLAGLLLQQGHLQQAEEQYQRILKQDSRHQPALQGLALVQARQHHYRSAHETLQKLLLLKPNDAQAWLNYGDVCMFMGDRTAAREAWRKASGQEQASGRIAQRAQKRLEIYRLDSLAVGNLDEP